MKVQILRNRTTKMAAASPIGPDLVFKPQDIHCLETDGNTEAHPWPRLPVDHEFPPARLEHRNVVLEVAPILEESVEPRLQLDVLAGPNRHSPDLGGGGVDS